MPFASAWRIYRLLRYHSDMTCYDLSWPDSARYGVTCYDNTGNDFIFVFCKLTYTACFGIAIFDSIIACLVITGMWHLLFYMVDVYLFYSFFAIWHLTGLTFILFASVLPWHFLQAWRIYRLLRYYYFTSSYWFVFYTVCYGLNKYAG